LCYFDCPIAKGQSYIIVDDILTSGRTMRDLMRYVELNGGNVIGFIAERGDLEHRLSPSPETREQFQNTFTDKSLVDQFLRRASLSTSQLTDGEMKALTMGYRSSAFFEQNDPRAYLEKLTKDWKVVELPIAISQSTAGVQTDFELARRRQIPVNKVYYS